MLALFGTGYAQTGLPSRYRRAMDAYVFPANRELRWLEARPAPDWVNAAVGGLFWVNLFVNLTLVAWPVERVLTKGWWIVRHWLFQNHLYQPKPL